MDIVERLRGIYRAPITDGLGAAGGDEPDNPHEFVRKFETPPIQHEAADEIEQLRKDKQLGFELMDVFIKEINRLKHMIAQYALYDEGPRLDDRGDNLDGN